MQVKQQHEAPFSDSRVQMINHCGLKLSRKIGLIEGIGLVTGGVIGMGVYSLIPSIVREAGSGAWLAITVALIISVIGVLPLIQIASAMPVAGGGYFYCSRLLHPLLGTIVSFLAIIGGSSSVCVVLIGLGEFISPYLSSKISLHVLAMLMLGGFILLNQFGLRVVTWLQLVLSAQLVLSLLLYAAGIGWFKEVHYTFTFPGNTGGFIMAVILSLNVCLGFQIIAELGEEIRHARRNIPLSLFLGGIVILIIYLVVTLSYTSVTVQEGEAFHRKEAALLETARMYLPNGLVLFILLGAVSAGLTSLNAAAIALPREFYAQARDHIITPWFSHIHKNTGTPLRAVNAFFTVVFLLLTAGMLLDTSGALSSQFKKAIDFYAYMAVCGIMSLTVFVSIAAFRLPGKYPALYNKAYLRLPRTLLFTAIVISVVTALGLIIILFMESALIMSLYLGLMAVVIVYYYLRSAWLARQGKYMGQIYRFEDKEI
ncbi:MAG: hypothetical protein KatS3mg031_0362 [Chitinophagales bacterium]|nr:MAG: hypothetical protein KatS3mg031_0362 [Chitinophagales bacterium]